MRLLRVLAPLACLCALQIALPSASVSTPAAKRQSSRAIRAGKDVLVAAPGDANYAYGPRAANLRALRAAAHAAPSSNFVVSYSGFDAASMNAFKAAIDIWAQTIASPVPIRVRANFTPLGAGILGSAGPTNFCSGDVPNTLYAAPLADALLGSAFCASAQSPPDNAEIEADFNSTFADWDFGTTGTGVPGKYNFMTVVLHEIGHGLGFFGFADSAGGVGTLSPPSIFDRFVQTGGGTPLLSFPTPSVALHQQLVGNSLFFSGPTTNAVNGGQPGKIEAHNFTTDYGVSSDNGFLLGSSYSHADDVLYSGTPNGLMTWALNSNEVYTDAGPLVRGIFRDEGWTVCTFALGATSVTVGPAAGNNTVSLTTETGCNWAVSGASPFASINPTTGTGSGVLTYTVTANPGVGPRTAVFTVGGQTFTIIQNGTGPTMSIDRNALTFGAVTSGTAFTSQTPTQTVRLLQSGAGAVPWTATSSAPWLKVANGSGAPGSQATGSGSATLNVSVAFVPGLRATETGTITLTFTGAGSFAGPIGVTLTQRTSATVTAPTGSFDSPANGTTGAAGSIGLTGWALDDIAVTHLRIMRDPVAGETAGVQLPIGEAAFVDGARPDVARGFPTFPQNTRAGWGYLMLTNFLPNQGNGTFVFYAYADDADGHTTLVGKKTISCDNAHSVAPFGAIDTPSQGGVVNGFTNNFGWVLSPGMARADGLHGGTTTVFVDGVNLGSPGGWSERSDLTSMFPEAQYSGVKNANAVFGLDASSLANGVHTIAWVVIDNAGHGAGIGSRFFTVANGNVFADPSGVSAAPSNVVAASPVLDVPKAAAARASSPSALAQLIDAAPADASAIQGRRGFDESAPLREFAASDGSITVHAEELDRVELQLGGGAPARYSGYLRTAGGVAPLPIGSRLDPTTGAFTWMPGVGFVGRYDLVFVRWSGARAVARQDVAIVLDAKRSTRVGAQVIVDLPSARTQRGAVVSGSFLLAGWAADLGSTVDSGVDAVHVWAYPVNAAGQWDAPSFLGAAVYGGARPDVAAVYGDRFRDSGYGLTVRGLAPGTYDLALFAYSTTTRSFAPAKLVRVTVK